VEDRELEDLAVVLPALLQSLEALGFVARYLNPPDLPQVMQAIGAPDAGLRAALPRLAAWSDSLSSLRGPLETAGEAVITAFDELKGAVTDGGDLRRIFRGLRHAPLAQEALYPLAGLLPPVNRFFLEPALRADSDLQARLARLPAENAGIMHLGGAPGARGGFSLYVPEYYTPDIAWPLVVALHGGSGNGRAFLWSWLRDARSHGAILVAPTAVGETWAISGSDHDTPNLNRILDQVRAGWTLDPERLLLTGMSDGGTFSYVTGLETDSPFTHLAPVAAAFHPMIAQMADPDRIAGLPIHLAHGALDWMFPVDVAREAHRALSSAGAAVTYREIPDLSHTYPRELNPQILAWLRATPRPAPG
jgi:phospholipase/carboxylesterase